jgi:hypothetical protein
MRTPEAGGIETAEAGPVSSGSGAIRSGAEEGEMRPGLGDPIQGRGERDEAWRQTTAGIGEQRGRGQNGNRRRPGRAGGGGGW